MKVLLVQDVANLGSAGEVKEVAGGYGRNYLIPKGFAVLATRGQVKQAEERMAAQHKRNEAARRDTEALAARINGQTLRFTARVGELDRLYGSVTNADVAEKLQQTLGIEVDRRRIDLDEPIRRIGIYPVKIRLAQGIEPMINVIVEGEEGAIQPASAEVIETAPEDGVPEEADEQTDDTEA
jgi:large subunit ribosomal protein L9